VPSFTDDTADSQNSVSDVNCVTDAAIFSGILPLSDLQQPSTSSNSHVVASSDAESDCRPSQPAEEILQTDELSSYEMYASPPPNDCLNDIWLSSAAVDLGSPLKLRGSGSCTAVHEPAILIGSPLMPRGSGSCITVHEHAILIGPPLMPQGSGSCTTVREHAN